MVPTTVQPGDALVLFLNTNSTTATVNDTIAGWTLIETRDGNGVRGRAWTKTATSTDDGAAVTVTSSAGMKSVMTVAAYRSTVGTATVTASASAVGNSSVTSHTTPGVAVAEPGSWLVNYWSEKSNAALTWTLPGNVTSRSTGAGTGTGKMSGILGDSNGSSCRRERGRSHRDHQRCTRAHRSVLGRRQPRRHRRGSGQHRADRQLHGQLRCHDLHVRRQRHPPIPRTTR